MNNKRPNIVIYKIRS